MGEQELRPVPDCLYCGLQYHRCEYCNSYWKVLDEKSTFEHEARYLLPCADCRPAMTDTRHLWYCPECKQTICYPNWKTHWFEGRHVEPEADKRLALQWALDGVKVL